MLQKPYWVLQYTSFHVKYQLLKILHEPAGRLGVRQVALPLTRISVFPNIRLSPFKAYKSSYEEPALKARGSKAQGEGRAAAETLGRDEVHEEP